MTDATRLRRLAAIDLDQLDSVSLFELFLLASALQRRLRAAVDDLVRGKMTTLERQHHGDGNVGDHPAPG